MERWELTVDHVVHILERGVVDGWWWSRILAAVEFSKLILLPLEEYTYLS